MPDFLDEKPLERCIRRPLKDDPDFFNECIQAYNMYQKDKFPNESQSYNGQPLGYLQIINIIESTLSECNNTKEIMRRRKESNKKRSGIK